MKCADFKIQIPEYLTGDLSASHEEAFKMHMSRCSECRQELQDINEIWTKLDILPDKQPSKKMRKRFYSLLEETREALHHRTGNRIFASIWKNMHPPRPALQIGFSLIILVLGFVAGSVLTSQKTLEKEMVSLRKEIRNVQETAAISMLQQESTFDRLNGVTWSSNIKKPDRQLLKTLLNTLNHDPSTNVRLAVVDALYLFSDMEMVKHGLVQSLTIQQSPIVQTALINLLVEIREKNAVQALRKLIGKRFTDPEVKEFAETSLEKLVHPSVPLKKRKNHAL